jgi:hypothetical protein
MKKKYLTIFMAFVLAITLFPTGMLSVQAATVKLNKTKASIDVGSTFTLKLSGTTSKATWTSSDKSIVTVKSATNGLSAKLSAKKAGKATVTAKIGKTSYTCEVNVTKLTIKSYKGMFDYYYDSKDGSYDIRTKGDSLNGVIEVFPQKEIRFWLSATIDCSVYDEYINTEWMSLICYNDDGTNERAVELNVDPASIAQIVSNGVKYEYYSILQKRSATDAYGTDLAPLIKKMKAIKTKGYIEFSSVGDEIFIYSGATLKEIKSICKLWDLYQLLLKNPEKVTDLDEHQ